MKKLIMSIILLYSCFVIPSEALSPEEDFALLQEAIEIIGSMSDNIANIATQYKNDTNSTEITKDECVNIVKKLTAFVVIMLKRKKLKKASRAINLYSPEDIDAAFDHLGQELLNKINLG